MQAGVRLNKIEVVGQRADGVDAPQYYSQRVSVLCEDADLSKFPCLKQTTWLLFSFLTGFRRTQDLMMMVRSVVISGADKKQCCELCSIADCKVHATFRLVESWKGGHLGINKIRY